MNTVGDGLYVLSRYHNDLALFAQRCGYDLMGAAQLTGITGDTLSRDDDPECEAMVL